MVDRGTVRHDEVRAERWVVRGIAKVARDVDVGLAELGGTVVVGGTFAAEEISLRGSLDARGAIAVARRFRSHGTVEGGASVRAREARLEGSVHIAAELVAETTLRVHGTLRAPSVTCGRFELRGTAAVPGTVTATSFDAQLAGDSTFGLVQAHDVRLRGPTPNLVRRVLGGEVAVTVERVEAESVFVEGARVQFVRAGKIVLGRNAHVATVEGRVVRAHPTSRQGPEAWSRPPAGLSR